MPFQLLPCFADGMPDNAAWKAGGFVGQRGELRLDSTETFY